MKTATNLTKTVDQLGKVKAEIATLEVQEKKLRDVLVESGEEAADGKLFRATVIRSTVDRVDYKQVVNDLVDKFSNHPNVLQAITNLVEDHTEVAERVTVKVVSR